jgi:hypothetical protein
MVNSSFFTDGGIYDSADVVPNDHPASTAPSQAPSSFYPNGQAYTQADVEVTDAARDEAVAAAAAALASQTAAASSTSWAQAYAAAALASQNAAATSASNAATSEANALASKNAAATSASNASTSEGWALAYKNAAATSAANAATSETNAHTSELNAASSATAAATSATNAASAVQAAAGTATPFVDGTAAVGTGTKWAREDHRHPTDTSRASVTYVDAQDALKAPLASPAFTGTPTVPTAAVGTNTTQAASTAFVLANASSNGRANVIAYGADPTGAADSLAAFTAAAATGKDIDIPNGTYKLTNKWTLSTPGQQVFGQDRNNTIILINSATFNMAATAVIAITAAEPGCNLSDFTIKFVQPDTAVRANLSNYPTAIDMKNAARSHLKRLMIYAGMVGIDARDNVGGARFEDLHMACFNQNLMIDGALSMVFVKGCVFWPFGLTLNQQTPYFDTNAVGIDSGRCDGLYITDTEFEIGVGLHFFSGTRTNAGMTFGTMQGGGFDSHRAVINDGMNWFNMTGGYMTPAGTTSDSDGINHRATGSLKLVGYEIAGPATRPFITVNSAAAEFSATGCHFQSGAVDKQHIVLAAGEVILTGNKFWRTPGVNYTTQTIIQFAGRLTAHGNRFNDRGTGTGNTAIYISSNDYHNIVGNSAPGWTYTYVAGAMYQAGNI